MTTTILEFGTSAKACSRCKQNKHLSLFPVNKRVKNGLDSWCRNCRKESAKSPERREQNKKSLAARKIKNPDKFRAARLKKFGLTVDSYTAMLISQNCVCAICNQAETSRDSRSGLLKALAVDHCHNSNANRGLLCDRCNTSIGKFEDRPDLLRNAANYLEKYKNIENKEIDK